MFFAVISKAGRTSTGFPSRSVALDVPVSAGSASPSLRVPRGAFTISPVFLVQPVELVVAAALGDVGLAQEAVVVGPDEERQVGLLLDEVFVDLAFVDDDLAHREGEGGVCTNLYGDPEVGVDGRGVVVRGDRDDLRPVVAWPPR